MKILIINNGYPTKSNVQYSSYIQQMYECICAAGFIASLEVMNIDYHSKFGKMRNYIRFYIKLLFRSYSEFDVVYIHNPIFCLPTLIRIPHSKMAVHWHGTDLLAKGVVKKLLRLITIKLSRKANWCFGPSEYFADRIREIVSPSSQVFVTPSGGVDQAIFSSIVRKKAKKKEIFVVGYASSMTAQKGVDIFIELAKMFRTVLVNETEVCCEYRMIEYGKECDEYLIKARQANVLVKSKMNKNQLAEFYGDLDVLVFPTRSEESLGLVAVEAMACGVPVLGSNIAALPEYIIPGISGELFEVSDLNSLYKGFQRLICNLEKYKPDIVSAKYSKESVVEFYRKMFSIR